MIEKLQLLVVTTTTIGVWSNLYVNYRKVQDVHVKTNTLMV